jgi:hypothetical protein
MSRFIPYQPDPKVKSIALIGNAPALLFQGNHCEEIDGADLVVRVSKMCNFASGLAGSRTDVLFLEPNSTFHHIVTQEQLARIRSVPHVFVRHDMRNHWDGEYHQVPFDTMRSRKHTSFAVALRNLRELYPAARITLYGAVVGWERRKQIQTAIHQESDEDLYIQELEASGMVCVRPLLGANQTPLVAKIRVMHPGWCDEMEFFANGYCHRVAQGDGGRWRAEDSCFVVEWANWKSIETFEPLPGDQANTNEESASCERLFRLRR